MPSKEKCFESFQSTVLRFFFFHLVQFLHRKDLSNVGSSLRTSSSHLNEFVGWKDWVRCIRHFHRRHVLPRISNVQQNSPEFNLRFLDLQHQNYNFLPQRNLLLLNPWYHQSTLKRKISLHFRKVSLLSKNRDDLHLFHHDKKKVLFETR